MTDDLTATLAPYGLRCEHHVAPLGIGTQAPLLSWRLRSTRRGDEPVSYRVVVTAASSGDETVWDSGEVADPAAVSVRGPELAPRTRYHWQVTVTSADELANSAGSWFETGHDDWTASWITHDPSDVDVVDAPDEGAVALPDHGLRPPVELRREFTVRTTPDNARLYITARGLYEAHLNGHRVGDHELAPGWTDYRDRVDYQTHDVTELLQPGDNLLEVTVADGWWSGYVGFDPRRSGAHYGTFPELIAELHFDGEIIGTDGTWQSRRATTRYADLLMGECHDLRREPEPWRPAVVTGDDHTRLTPAVAPPVRVTEELPAKSVAPGENGYIVDFGQNVAGRVRLTARGLHPGDRVVVRHGEALNIDGTLHTDNLRTAEATDILVAGAEATVTFEPRFTYHGFRYAEVTGLTELSENDITAVVLGSDTPPAGEFACDDPAIQRLHHNIQWGQRGNFVSVPTDCPQRDERLGWLADAQVFLPTACYNADVAAFFAGWLREVRGAQSPDGGFTNVAPKLAGVADEGAPGWADAGVLIPWHLYRTYGDEQVLTDNLDAMVRWVDFVHRHNPDLVWRHKVGPHFADWLALTPTPREVVATAYFARSAELTGRAAAVLGEENTHHLNLAAHIRKTFVETFTTERGRIAGDTQTGYLLALAFELLPDDLVPLAVDRLVELVTDAGPAVTTGFLGVSLIAPVLDQHGHPDLAHALLRRTEPPSWLYPLRHNATTIWERWDGYTEEAGFQVPAMNSFNHYALGSVGEWLYRGVAGLDQAPDSVGYRDLLIRPRLGRLGRASARYESVRGTTSSAWSRVDGVLRMDVSVPPGATATVHVPTADPGGVRERDLPVREAAGVRVVHVEPGTLVCRLTSGTFHFTAAAPPPQEKP
ncbi:family 78 glycoside hydrolase catalytic domain [Amycolatopsis sp. NPDC051045]|uniref:alpha-L-rhamnosidase n=1 Tax=Amycolatopsis sp. NPDC051045 TaxID=3156922 RepID=UPI00344211AA